MLPPDLQQVLGLPVRAIRVPNEIDAKIRGKHAQNLGQYEDLNRWLADSQYAGQDPNDAMKWEVYIPLSSLHWLAVVIGRDKNGSHNLVSVYMTRSRNVRNRIKRGYLGVKTSGEPSAPEAGPGVS
jgi:hypothetical protein